MKSVFTDTIIRTGIFIICAQVLVHFRPKSSYEKYFKMLVSAMILIQLFLPVSNLLTGENGNSLAMRVEWFQEQLEQSMERMGHISIETEGVNMEIADGIEFGSESSEQQEKEEIHIAPIDKIMIEQDTEVGEQRSQE